MNGTVIFANFDLNQKKTFRNLSELRTWLKNEAHLDGATLFYDWQEGEVKYTTVQNVDYGDSDDPINWEIQYGFADEQGDHLDVRGESDGYETSEDAIEAFIDHVIAAAVLATPIRALRR